MEAYDEYARRIPGLKNKPVPMAIDEWAYARPSNLKSSLADAFVLQEMFRHSELIVMAGHTMATAAIEFNATAPRSAPPVSSSSCTGTTSAPCPFA